MLQKNAMWTAVLAGSVLAAGALAQDAIQPSKGLGADEQITFNFDKDAVGKLPEGWKAGQAAGSASGWAVASDPTAPSSPNVLEASMIGGGQGFNLCYCPKHSFKDVDVTAKLHPNGGKLAMGGLVAWRVKDADTYYACGVDPQEGKFHVYKVIDGKMTDLKTTDFKGAGPGASTWYTVRAKMSGDSITCWVDGKEVAQATDSSIKEPGHVGVATRMDATASFDDLRVAKLGGGDSPREPKAPKDPAAPGDPKSPKGGG